MNAPEGADDNALNNSRGVSELRSNNAPPTMSLNVDNANLKGNKKRKGNDVQPNLLNDDAEEDSTNKLSRRKRASNNGFTRPSYKLHRLPFVSIVSNNIYKLNLIHHTHTSFLYLSSESERNI